ncbi:hypothetical protein [Streptomyces nanshensis]|uniref:Uncharacterized protein n=1 Tax=Streptomyces nanshensis TaxID=518642 RepID=A0A1E7KZT9_9ACTN|nr:hypothetical protein [Streptomyces nanshensis]OEV09323.1 hypothetical protein AN218_23125 [Streptomyces nanshensis]
MAIRTVLLNPLARLLIAAADRTARHCDIPNPMAGMRHVIGLFGDQNLSGADIHSELCSRLEDLGFDIPQGWCNVCNRALTNDQAEATGLCIRHEHV